MKAGRARRGSYTLGIGTVLTDGGQVLRVAGIESGPEGPVVVLDVSGRQERVSFGELCQRTEWLSPLEPSSVSDPDEYCATFSALPAPVRARTLQLARHLRQVRTGSPDGNLARADEQNRVDPRYDPRAEPVLRDRLRTKSLELLAAGWTGATEKSLYRKLERFEALGIEGLVDRRWLRYADPVAAADPRVVAAVGDVIAANLTQARLSRHKLSLLVRMELEARELSDEVTTHQLRVLVGELSRGHALHRSARSRRTHANRPDGEASRLPASRPGELVQIDGTPSNVHVYFPDSGWGPATILSAIDVYTRQILALRVVAGAATSRDTSLLLWDICRPTVTAAGWPRELRRWHGVPTLVLIDVEQTRLGNEPHPGTAPLIGTKPAVVPSTVVIDHGSEFDSEGFLSGCDANGIDVIFARPMIPTDKGNVESWHYTLDQALRGIPGYKGANPQDHPPDAERDAALSAADLHDMLWTWILTVYHNTPHGGLRDVRHPTIKVTPNLAYDRFVQVGGRIRVNEDPYRVLSFLSAKQRIVQADGIHLHNRVFNHECLHDLRQRTQRGTGTKAKTVTVVFDRWDLTRIYLRSEAESRWVCIPAATPGGTAVAPFSQALTQAAIESTLRGEQPINNDERRRRELQVLAAWSAGNFRDRRDRHLHGLEEARQAAYAHDLEDWSQELRELAFPALSLQGGPGLDGYAEAASDDEQALGASEVFNYDPDTVGDLAL